MFDAGDKVYSKSMKKNLVVACVNREIYVVCIDISNSTHESKRFESYLLSISDLEIGWKSNVTEINGLREIK